jgi:hypothetical protein
VTHCFPSTTHRDAPDLFHGLWIKNCAIVYESDLALQTLIPSSNTLCFALLCRSKATNYWLDARPSTNTLCFALLRRSKATNYWLDTHRIHENALLRSSASLQSNKLLGGFPACMAMHAAHRRMVLSTRHLGARHGRNIRPLTQQLHWESANDDLHHRTPLLLHPGSSIWESLRSRAD